MRADPSKMAHLLVLTVALMTGCGPPFFPAIYQARETTHVYNGGLLHKQYELTRDVALVRQGLRRPVLAPAGPLPTDALVRTGGPSSAVGGAWGIWGEQHLACYRPRYASPCKVPTGHQTVARGVRLTIESIMVEDLEYPPPVFYVQARLQDGPHSGVLVDISELVEDCVPPDSAWRERPIVVNDNYLQPVMLDDPPLELQALVVALDDGRWQVRFQAVRQLPEVDADATSLVSALLYAQQDPDPEVAYEAIESLGRLGARAEQAVPLLFAAMKRNDKPDGYCRRAAYAIASIQRPVSPVLMRALQDETWRLRYLAGEGLASLGPEAAPALPTLLKVLRSPAERQAHHAPEYIARAMYRIAPEESTRELIRLLRDGNDDEQRRAGRALGALAPTGENAIAPLVHLAGHQRVDIRVHAISALGEFGDRAAVAVPAIICALENTTERGILAATSARALGNIGPPAKAAIPALERYARRSTSDDRAIALAAMKKIRAGQ